MKARALFVCLLVVLTLVLPFQSVQAASDALLKQGISLAYNFEIEQAQKIFAQISKHDPADPRPYYYTAQIQLWKYVSNSDQADLNTMLKTADQCIEKLQVWESKNGKKAELAATYLGNIYMQKAIAYGKAENYLEMVNMSQKSYTYLSNAIKADPKNYDAYLGLGVFRFALSRVPSSVSYLLNVAGFKTTITDAYEYVQTAAKKATFMKIEAQYYLGELQREYLFEYAESIKSFKAIVAKYPRNPLFTYSLGVTYIKNHQLEEGKRSIQKLINRDAKHFGQLNAYAYMLLGDIAFYQNRFAEAIPQYTKFFTLTKTKDFSGIAHLRLGLCYQLKSKLDLAKKQYELAAEGNRTLDDDAFAYAKSVMYAKYPPQPEDIKLYKFANYIEAGSYKKAVDSLVYLLSMVAATERAPIVKYYLSQAYFFKGDLKQSMQFSQEIIVNKRDGDDWMKPFSYLNAAHIDFKKGDIDAAKTMLTKSEQYSDFLYASLLKNKVEALRFNMQKPVKKAKK
jgi:hypothetical protein